jgi:hypothetical protein
LKKEEAKKDGSTYNRSLKMKIEEKIEKYFAIKEGKFSWADTDEVAKKMGAKYKSGQKTLFANIYVFKNIDSLQAFSDVMKKKFMNFKADPDGLEVKVWF